MDQGRVLYFPEYFPGDKEQEYNISEMFRGQGGTHFFMHPLLNLPWKTYLTLSLLDTAAFLQCLGWLHPSRVLMI